MATMTGDSTTMSSLHRYEANIQQNELTKKMTVIQSITKADRQAPAA